ncbi:hypothetical protein KBD61_02330 [Patescibacteria group bacterium]|nr:hypothetical protein [Patescibacteria group bacterium]MBP9709846.1 hypothetical protein [Patescibacteria group bacterium]
MTGDHATNEGFELKDHLRLDEASNGAPQMLGGQPAPAWPDYASLLRVYEILSLHSQERDQGLPFVANPLTILADEEHAEQFLTALHARRCILLREDDDESLPERALIIQPPTEQDHVYPLRILLSEEDMAEINAMPTVLDGNKDSRCLVNGVEVAEEGDDVDSDDGGVPSPDANAHIRVMHDARAALSAMIQCCLEALKRAADDDGTVLWPLRVIEDVLAQMNLPAGTAVEFINTLIHEGYAFTAPGYAALQLIQPSAPAERTRMAEDDAAVDEEKTVIPQQVVAGNGLVRFRGKTFPPSLLPACIRLLREHATPEGIVYDYITLIKRLLAEHEVDPGRYLGVIKKLRADAAIIHFDRRGYIVISLPAKPGLSRV